MTQQSEKTPEYAITPDSIASAIAFRGKRSLRRQYRPNWLALAVGLLDLLLIAWMVWR